MSVSGLLVPTPPQPSVSGYLMGVLGYLMRVLGYSMAWRRRQAMAKCRWGRKWRGGFDKTEVCGKMVRNFMGPGSPIFCLTE